MSDKPTIYHCVDLFHGGTEYDRARKAKARATWEVLYQNHGVVPCYYEKYARDSRAIGCSKGLPFLKDVVANGLSKCENESDICLLTNDDNLLHIGIAGMIRTFCSIYGGGTAQRREFKNIAYPDYFLPPEQITAMSMSHIGRDAVFGTKKWWLEHWEEIPNFLLGSHLWDICFAVMVRRWKGFSTNHNNLYDVIQCCELPLGYISHSFHESAWPKHSVANDWNENQFRIWRDKYMPSLRLPL